MQSPPKHVPPPAPSHNGGLYTGAPFQTGAAWRNFPVVPDGVYMTSINLKSANPPPGATSQFAGSVRPGNNYQNMPSTAWFSGQHSLLCNRQPACNPSTNASEASTTTPRFAGFFHL